MPSFDDLKHAVKTAEDRIDDLMRRFGWSDREWVYSFCSHRCMPCATVRDCRR